MSDFLLRLVETARGAVPGLRADVPATVLDAPLEIDEEIEARPLVARVGPAASVAPAPVAPSEPQRTRPPRDAAPTTRPLSPEPAPAPRSRPARPESPAASVPAAAPARQPVLIATPATIEERIVRVSSSPAEPPPLVAAVARRPEALPSRRRGPSGPVQPSVEERFARGPAAAPEPSLHLAAARTPVAPTEEVVRISIGRIEVRTVAPATPRPAPVPLARPRQSLDDHLAERDRARR